MIQTMLLKLCSEYLTYVRGFIQLRYTVCIVGKFRVIKGVGVNWEMFKHLRSGVVKIRTL